MLLGVLVCIDPAAQARSDDRLLTEHDFFAELPVVLTATRLRQPVADAPAAVTIVDRDLIEASGARELVDILRLVPGMLVARHTSHEPIVTYGGLGERFSRRIQVLVDGRSVYQPFSGGVLWTDLGLAIEDIQHIEVIRGPNAAAYGPNSFQAIINIITRHPAENPGRHVTSRIGTNGIRDLVARQSASGRDLDYRLTLATQGDHGFPDAHNSQRADFANLRTDYRLSPEHTFSTRAGVGQSRKERGFEDDPINPERHFRTYSSHLQLRLDQDRGTGDSWSVQYYFQQNRIVDEFMVNFMGLDLPIDENVRTDRHDLELERRSQLSTGTRIVWGGGLRRDNVVSPTYFGDRSPESDDLYRVFGNLEHALNFTTTLNLGAMVEHSELFGGKVSPRAALNLRVHPEHTLRVIAARATRTPTLTEERARRIYEVDVGLPDPVVVPVLVAEGGLSQETVDYAELGHHATFRDTGLILDTKVFSNRVRHLIDSSNASLSFADRGGVTYQGVEVQLDYGLGRHTRLHGGFTYHFNREDHSEQGDGRYAAAIPKRIISTALSSRVSDALRVSATYYHYSLIDWIDGAPSDAYDGFLDLSARWTLNRNAQLALTVQDVLARGYDTRTPENSDIYQVNRRETRSFATLSLDF